MPRLALSLGLLALAAGTLDVEARPRFRLGASRPVTTSTVPVPAPIASSRAGGVVLLPGSRDPVPSIARPDLPTGSVGAAGVTPAVGAEGSPKQPARPARDPCAASQLFGSGAGFCIVN